MSTWYIFFSCCFNSRTRRSNAISTTNEERSTGSEQDISRYEKERIKTGGSNRKTPIDACLEQLKEKKTNRRNQERDEDMKGEDKCARTDIVSLYRAFKGKCTYIHVCVCVRVCVRIEQIRTRSSKTTMTPRPVRTRRGTFARRPRRPGQPFRRSAPSIRCIFWRRFPRLSPGLAPRKRS